VLAADPLFPVGVGVDGMELFDVLFSQHIVGECFWAVFTAAEKYPVVQLLHMVPVLDERLEGDAIALGEGAPVIVVGASALEVVV